jgi:hypothetical protein
MNLLPGGILVAQPLFIPSPCEGLAVRFCKSQAEAAQSDYDRKTRTGSPSQGLGIKSACAPKAIELVALKARRQGLFPLKSNVVKSGCQEVPSGTRSGFRSHNMRLGFHSHRAPAKRPVH